VCVATACRFELWPALAKGVPRRPASSRLRKFAVLALVMAASAAAMCVCSVATSEHVRRDESRREAAGGEYYDNPVPGDPSWRINTFPRLILNDKRCRSLFRLGSRGFSYMTSVLTPHLTPAKGPPPQPPDVQCGVFLYYVAHGSGSQVAAEQFGLSHTTTKRIINNVLAALAIVYPDHVRWPETDEERSSISNAFYEARGIPNIIGCVDGTHIPCRAPNNVKSSYVNRKGWTSNSVMAVCDDQLRFTYIVPDPPGCAHDSRIFHSSNLPTLAREASSRGYYLLGDPAYGNTQYLLTPYPHDATLLQRNYNFCHSSTRMAIECAFGKFKGQWKIFDCLIPKFSPDRLTLFVWACAVLHNITIDHDHAGRARCDASPICVLCVCVYVSCVLL
jgi:hypothetical protein